MDNADSRAASFGRSQWISTGLLFVVPVAPILKYLIGASPVWIFAAGDVAMRSWPTGFGEPPSKPPSAWARPSAA